MYKIDKSGKWESSDGIGWMLTEPSNEFLSNVSDEQVEIAQIPTPTEIERIEALESAMLEMIMGGAI